MRVTQTLDELRAALSDGNVQAWLRLTRHGETSATDPDAYHALYGWTPQTHTPRFDDLSGHPKIAITSRYGNTSAAGAYQAMAEVPGKVTIDTWDNCFDWCRARGYNLTMQPEDQDLFAVWCTARRGALPAVLQGQIEAAVALCRQEWASLPGAGYGQPERALADLLEVYRRHGGVIGGPAVAAAAPPAPEPPAIAPPAPPKEPKTMADPITGAVIGALASTIIDAFAPKLQREIGRHVDPESASKVTDVVVSAAKTVTGLPDPVQAVAAVRADPKQAQQVEQIVTADLERLGPLLDRIAALQEQSRAAALDRNIQLGHATGGRWLTLLGAAALVVLVCSYVITGVVLFRDGFSDETRALLLGQVVVLGFASVVGWLFGSNIANRVGQQQRVERSGGG